MAWPMKLLVLFTAVRALSPKTSRTTPASITSPEGVEVAWVDARSNSRWMTESDFKEWRADFGSREIQSCGYLVHADGDNIVLSLSKDTAKERMVAHVLEIPKGMVRWLKEV